MRYTENGTAVTNFSLAVNNRRRDENGDWVEDTEWFRVTAWERQAESVNQYLSKGSRVFVDGSFSTSQYTSSSGVSRTALEVRASNVRFLDSPNGDSTTGGVQTEAESIDPVLVGEAATHEEQGASAEAAWQEEQEEEAAAEAQEAAAEAAEAAWQEAAEAEEAATRIYDSYDDETSYDNLTPEGMGSDEIDWESQDYE